MTDYQAEKKTAEEFIEEQVEKMTEEQKRRLADILLGATMASDLIGPRQESRG